MTAFRKMETFPISTSVIDGIELLQIKSKLLIHFSPGFSWISRESSATLMCTGSGRQSGQQDKLPHPSLGFLLPSALWRHTETSSLTGDKKIETTPLPMLAQSKEHGRH